MVRRAAPVAGCPTSLGIAWVVVAAIVVMVPALAHGWSLGPFDQLDRLGLSQHFGLGTRSDGSSQLPRPPI